MAQAARQLAASLSARRAWIEMDDLKPKVADWSVALRKESVDRNQMVVGSLIMIGGVALRKESVDRNSVAACPFSCCGTSLSARRAWIEILWFRRHEDGSLRRSPQGERG